MNVKELTKRILTNRHLALAFRLYIGGIFVYASLYKINYPAEFAEAIASYQLAPFWAVNFLAVVMPWMELICGVLLICGIRCRSVTAAICAMMLLFSGAVFLSLVRGIPIGCGCFSSVGEALSWTTLLRDLTWLALGIHVYFFDSILHLDSKFIMNIKEAQP